MFENGYFCLNIDSLWYTIYGLNIAFIRASIQLAAALTLLILHT